MTVADRRSAIVTGATGGLGREICRQLADCGWDLIAGWHRSEEAARLLCCELDACGVQVRPVRLDMANVESVAAAIDFGPSSPIEALIVNAVRLPQVAPFGRIDVEEVRSQFEISAVGPYELIRVVWRRHFRSRRKGHLIVVSTTGVELPPAPRMAGYIVGKAALEAVAACATSEYGPGGLATTIVRPGYIDTPLLHAFEPRFVEVLREKSYVKSPAQAASMIVDAANNPPAAGEYIIHRELSR